MNLVVINQVGEGPTHGPYQRLFSGQI